MAKNVMQFPMSPERPIRTLRDEKKLLPGQGMNETKRAYKARGKKETGDKLFSRYGSFEENKKMNKKK